MRFSRRVFDHARFAMSHHPSGDAAVDRHDDLFHLVGADIRGEFKTQLAGRRVDQQNGSRFRIGQFDGCQNDLAQQVSLVERRVQLLADFDNAFITLQQPGKRRTAVMIG